MDIRNVIVFGATGLQGQPQVWEALRQGYKVKVASRNPEVFGKPEFKDVDAVRADYDDAASLEAALKGVDAVLVQVPSQGNLLHVNEQCAALAAAAKRARVQLIVFNSSMWAPDEPCGDFVFDGVLRSEEAFRSGGPPVIVFRPTLFMNNLLGAWIKPALVNEGGYRYCHKPDLASDWICHEDVATFMVAALKRPDLIGQKIHIGGPQRLTTRDVISILSRVIGRPIRLDYITPRHLGEMFYDLSRAGQGTGGEMASISREQYVKGFDDFYTFCNDAPQRPFQADVAAALRAIPVSLTDMETWARAQIWK